ncbi:acetolactate decarboxylase [Lactobacillus sp. DCY120]|uniref:Alpha-acetolactate decarboxylase n=1 Tax=Bombilactobacillus apium TaxID=2675299 RepID=A0A850QZQ2_9LACO|nr:acetolactate decarboxylase [Bombilactobacillus apium]NVY96269.1 acetolactate decarboxylase [Bombilactobacillus apium]
MTSVLYQHGTLALLVPGLLKGTMTMGELLEHGDYGIGTGEGLDGELIILAGKAYQVNGAGQVKLLSPDFTVPFASVHQGDYQVLATYQDLAAADFYQKVTTALASPNVFYSLKVQGTFRKMKTRAVDKTQPPYATLVEASEKQSIFEGENIAGTLISYYSPELFHGAAVAGYHSHFLAADHSMGGHILDFELATGQVEVQVFDTLEQHFPITDADYMSHDFGEDEIGNSISTAEAE